MAKRQPIIKGWSNIQKISICFSLSSTLISTHPSCTPCGVGADRGGAWASPRQPSLLLLLSPLPPLCSHPRPQSFHHLLLSPALPLSLLSVLRRLHTHHSRSDSREACRSQPRSPALIVRGCASDCAPCGRSHWRELRRRRRGRCEPRSSSAWLAVWLHVVPAGVLHLHRARRRRDKDLSVTALSGNALSGNALPGKAKAVMVVTFSESHAPLFAVLAAAPCPAQHPYRLPHPQRGIAAAGGDSSSAERHH